MKCEAPRGKLRVAQYQSLPAPTEKLGDSTGDLGNGSQRTGQGSRPV